MKYQIIVISCSEERREHMMKQIKDLNIKAPVYFLQGFTSSTSTDYIPSNISISDQRIICCTRSHLHALEYACNENSPQFSLIIEDDAAFHKTQLENAICEIIDRWDTDISPNKMVSFGWVPMSNYSKYDETFCEKTLKCISESKILVDRFCIGLQGYLVRKQDIKPLLDIFIQPTFNNLVDIVIEQKYKYITNRSDITTADILIPRILGQSTIFPPVIVEYTSNSMLGHSNEIEHWFRFFKNYEYMRNNYYNIKKNKKQRQLMFYDKTATWEIDYIKDIFSNIKYDIVDIDINKILSREEDYYEENTILIFSSNTYTYENIMKIVLKIKPKIIIHLSDEFGDIPNYHNLANYTNLLLRQHNFKHYIGHRNIYQIPLGYMFGMLNQNRAFINYIKPIEDRKYDWSFIGNMKKDRKEMIVIFLKSMQRCAIHNNMKSCEMFDIYNDSIFVPIGRGNKSLDCFRIYESILAGSCPVIVGEKEEYDVTFYYNDDIPNFILASTWDEAVEKCRQLLDNPYKLSCLQHDNYEWLKRQFRLIQNLIDIAL
jgi:hypothetical protein